MIKIQCLQAPQVEWTKQSPCGKIVWHAQGTEGDTLEKASFEEQTCKCPGEDLHPSFNEADKSMYLTHEIRVWLTSPYSLWQQTFVL